MAVVDISVEPVSPHPRNGSGRGGGRDELERTPALGGPSTPRSATPTHIRLGLATAAGFIGSFLIVVTSPVWLLAPPDSWRFEVKSFSLLGFDIPRIPAPPNSSFIAAAYFVVGIALMALGWIGLIGRARRGIGSEMHRLKLVVAVGVLWALPMLISPPQLSNDAYSYAAQGEMASRNYDTASQGPDVFKGQQHEYLFWRGADPFWRADPAPYGPVAIGAAETIVEVTQHDASLAVWGFRVFALLGVVMAGFGVVMISRSRGASPSLAFALAIANPVVLLHLIGGSHNDAVMMGLLVLGMAANERGRKILALVLLTLAMAVKLPAVLGLLFLAWNWKGKEASLKQRLASLPAIGAISSAIIAAMCWLVGMGFGWVTAVQNTGKVASTFSPFTKIGFLANDTWHWITQTPNEIQPYKAVVPGIVTGSRLIGLIAAGGIILYLLLRRSERGITKALGLALLALVLFGPVVWPWYLPAGFALVSAAGANKFRPSMIVLMISATAIVWPTSVFPIEELAPYQHWLGFGVVLLICASCFIAQKMSLYAEERRFRLDLEPLTSDRVLISAGVREAETV